jgi:hypothetical protein
MNTGLHKGSNCGVDNRLLPATSSCSRVVHSQAAQTPPGGALFLAPPPPPPPSSLDSMVLLLQGVVSHACCDFDGSKELCPANLWL